MHYIIDAIVAINPNAEATLTEEKYEAIIWRNNTPVISKEDIEAKQVELKTAWEAKDYSRKRKIEYDKLNQFEMQYDDLINNTTTWKDAILSIKAKYPKP